MKAENCSEHQSADKWCIVLVQKTVPKGKNKTDL